VSLPGDLFPSFLTKILSTPLLSPKCATCPAHLILLDLITRKIMGEHYRSLSSLLCSFPCHLFPLRPKYSPQHPILKHPQPTFLPQCERSSTNYITDKTHNILNRKANSVQDSKQVLPGRKSGISGLLTCFHL
jgi:hypothetical protein